MCFEAIRSKGLQRFYGEQLISWSCASEIFFLTGLKFWWIWGVKTSLGHNIGGPACMRLVLLTTVCTIAPFSNRYLSFITVYYCCAIQLLLLSHNALFSKIRYVPSTSLCTVVSFSDRWYVPREFSKLC